MGTRSTFALNVTTVGSGKVTSNPAGIDCGATCIASFIPKVCQGSCVETVTLTATPTAGSSFTGWGGACSGTALICTVTMDAAKSVTATFISGGTCTAPAAPTGLTATTQVGAAQMNLAWSAVAGVTYQIERTFNSNPASGTYTVIAPNHPSASFSDTGGLAANTTYVYRVKAVAACGGVSPPSNIDFATTVDYKVPIASGFIYPQDINPVDNIAALRATVAAVHGSSGATLNPPSAWTLFPSLQGGSGYAITRTQIDELQKTLKTAVDTLVTLGAPAVLNIVPYVPDTDLTFIEKKDIEALQRSVKGVSP